MQQLLDDSLDAITKVIYRVGRSRKLVKKRSIDKRGSTIDNGKVAAPPRLRQMRAEANQARKDYIQSIKRDDNSSTINEAKNAGITFPERVASYLPKCGKASTGTP